MCPLGVDKNTRKTAQQAARREHGYLGKGQLGWQLSAEAIHGLHLRNTTKVRGNNKIYKAKQNKNEKKAEEQDKTKRKREARSEKENENDRVERK